ncbi:MAG: GNAT family N-acetyltransferase [Deltaproteobacteria bacterium]|nr:GNAT family N-acetyltransferase [Deltaproteobacteria bacterium]
MKIIKAENHRDFEAIFPVIRELRPNLTFHEYTDLMMNAKLRDDYDIVAVFDGPKCIAAMGYRILYDFVHGKHLYIDDLVVTESCRSKGIGAELLRYAEQVAVEKKCKGLRLCTGVDRKDSQRFYERNNWNARAIAYKKTISGDV